MKATPIAEPVNGEKLVELRPPLALYPQVAWKQRLQHFSGRALTHDSLKREQNWLNGQMSALGRVVSAGVLEGLNVHSQRLARGEGDDIEQFDQLHISAGAALTRGGNTISLNREVTLPARNLFVFRHGLHPEYLSGNIGEANGYARELPTLAELLEDEIELPRAGILVLEPHYAEIWQAEEEDACPVDESNLPFENWQLMDACRLVLYTWPDNWLAMPSIGPAWRNRLAQAIFSKERSMDGHEVHPWELLGSAIALVGFSEDFQISFIDKHSVTRSGGRLALDSNGLAGEGNPFLWQAQLEQFNNQLAQLAIQISDRDELLASARNQLRYLPPVGVLPKPFAQPRENEQGFFPVNYSVRARVIPLEQLDVAIRESQPLLPFDLNSFDDVELLVPVQQNFYEANLLRIEAVDPAFDLAIREFTEERNSWLGKRHDVRQKAAAIYYAMKGRALDYSADADAIDDLELPAPQQQAVIELGSSWRSTTGNAPADNWNRLDFNDSDFQAQLSGWGYGKTLFETDLQEMRGRHNFLFVRKAFVLEEGDLNNRFELLVNTNASFVVFINGQTVFSHTPLATRAQLFGVRTRINQVVFTFDEQAIAAMDEGNNLIAIAVQVPRNLQHFYFSPRLLKTLSQTNYAALENDEEAYGLSVNLDNDDADALQPDYTVDEIEAFKTQVSDANPQLISDTELEQLDENGLEDFITLLDLKIASTNDLIDFNFARMRTEIYRIDQYIFGNEQGTKLATSPVLASIAQSSSSADTLKQLNAFFDGLRAGDQAAIVDGEDGGGEGGDDVAVAQPAASVRQPAGDLFISADLSAPVSRFESLSLASRTSSLSPVSGIGGSIGSSVIDFGGTTGSISSDVISGAVSTKENLVFKAGVDSSLSTLAARTSGADATALFANAATVDDIQEQSAIVGATSQYRNVTVGERLQESVALNSITSGVAAKAGVITGLRAQSGIVLDGITIPGVTDSQNNGAAVDLGTVSDQTIDEILNFDHDLDPTQPQDEATYFTGSIKALENTGVVLRKVEGRVHAYKRLRSQCQEMLKKLKVRLRECDLRLAELVQPLAEARHDLSTARALLAEEEIRVDKINAQRDAILKTRVPYYVFRRPRFAFSHQSAPVHTLFEKSKPGLPDCDFPDSTTSAELAGLIKLIKQVPVKWLSEGSELLKGLNRPDALYQIAEFSFQNINASVSYLDKLHQPASGNNQLAYMMQATLAANIQMVEASIKRYTKEHYVKILREDWQGASNSVREYCRLADIIDGPHGKAATSKQAAELLENIRKVVACIYHHFSEILPAVRVKWIDKFSQYDQSVPLHNLYNLPQWEQVDYETRRNAQKLVTWLYAQFEPKLDNARQFVDNLVRMCILLASEAPVGKIISGEIERQSSVKKGEQVDVKMPPHKVNVDDKVEIQHEGKPVATGIVKNIGKQSISMEVVEVKKGVKEVPAGAKAQVKQANRPAAKKNRNQPKKIMTVQESPKNKAVQKARNKAQNRELRLF